MKQKKVLLWGIVVLIVLFCYIFTLDNILLYLLLCMTEVFCCRNFMFPYTLCLSCHLAYFYVNTSKACHSFFLSQLQISVKLALIKKTQIEMLGSFNYMAPHCLLPSVILFLYLLLTLILSCTFFQFNGTATHPRLSVFCSDKQLYAMLVDDKNKKCLFYGSTLQKSFREDPPCSTAVSSPPHFTDKYCTSQEK